MRGHNKTPTYHWHVHTMTKLFQDSFVFLIWQVFASSYQLNIITIQFLLHCFVSKLSLSPFP